MKVDKAKFDALLIRMLKAKPEPRKKIKISGKKAAQVIPHPEIRQK